MAAPLSKDLSPRDISLMLALAENMFSSSVHVRCALRISAHETQSFLDAYCQLSRLVQIVPSLARAGSMGDFSSSNSRSIEEYLDINDEAIACCKCMGNGVLDGLQQLQQQLRGFRTANEKENVEKNSALTVFGEKEFDAAENVLIFCLTSLQEIIESVKPVSTFSSLGYISLLGYSFIGRFRSPILSPQQWNDLASKCLALKSYLASHYDDLVQLLTSSAVGALFSFLDSFYDRVSSLTRELHCSFQSCLLNSRSFSSTSLDSKVVTAATECIESCLLAVQNLQAIAAPREPIPSEEKPETVSQISLKAIINRSFQCFHAIRVKPLTEKIQSLHQLLKKTTSATSFAIVRLVEPYFEQLIKVYTCMTNDLCHAYKCLGKLDYVVLRVFRTLLAKGFCSAESDDNEGDGEGNSSFQDNVEGTGMGEGDGLKDVSDQIQNEDQLIGLKQEEEDQIDDGKGERRKELAEEDKDKGVEMQQEFGGDTFDTPQENDPSPEDDEEEEEDDKEELDRELGDVGLDNIVDEKQWNSEEDKQEGGEEKFEEGNAMEGETIQGESHTKEEEEEGDKEDVGEKEEKKKSAEGGDHQENGKELNEDLEENTIEKPLGVDVRPDDDGGKEEEEKTDGNKDGDNSEDGHHLPDEMVMDDKETNNSEDDMDPDSMDVDKELNEGDQLLVLYTYFIASFVFPSYCYDV